MPLYPELIHFAQSCIAEFEQIPEERKVLLEKLANYIRTQKQKPGQVALNFICTHNSRRSHLSQIWAATALAYYGVGEVQTFSGGTEATAFHPNAVTALQRAGFQIHNPGGDNPHYQVSFAEEEPVIECFSKVYNDPFNPGKDFAAIMTCSDADENCPYIPGASFRLALTYEDPKIADGTPWAIEKYDATVRRIARELLYACSLIKSYPND